MRICGRDTVGWEVHCVYLHHNTSLYCANHDVCSQIKWKLKIKYTKSNIFKKDDWWQRLEFIIGSIDIDKHRIQLSRSVWRWSMFNASCKKKKVLVNILTHKYAIGQHRGKIPLMGMSRILREEKTSMHVGNKLYTNFANKYT